MKYHKNACKNKKQIRKCFENGGDNETKLSGKMEDPIKGFHIKKGSKLLLHSSTGSTGPSKTAYNFLEDY